MPECFRAPVVCFVAFVFLIATPGVAPAVVITAPIDGRSGPWMWVNAGLNTAFQYGQNNQLAPFVVDPGNGFNFFAGQTLSIVYQSGTTSAGIGFSNIDGNGYTSFTCNANIGNSGFYFPSKYIAPGEYPTYLNALMGTFANSAGTIIGTPYEIGNSRSLTVPAGATRFQLGFNDDIFNDNSGSLTVQISLTGVPEPSSLLLTATVPVAFKLRRMRRVKS